MTLILSLTSIPPRFQYLPKFFQYIEKQKTRPDKVELYVPLAYRRFPGELPTLPELPDWVELIQPDFDLGPATKVLYCARKWRNKDCKILYGDDDRRYDVEWVSRFVEASKKHPDKVICESGFDVGRLSENTKQSIRQPRAVRGKKSDRTLVYRAKRLFTLGLYKPPRAQFAKPGYCDIAEGFRGVLTDPKYFDDRCFDIPEICWTVDDIWLSGFISLNSGKIWVNNQVVPGYFDTVKNLAHNTEPLFKFVEKGAGRFQANQICVDYFRDNFDVWR